MADSLLAVRWAEMVRSRGVRLKFSHNFVEAEEALEICHLPKRKPIATIFLGVNWVWVIDSAGRVTPHETLAAALCSLVTLTPDERRSLVTDTTPPWLWRPGPARPSFLQRLSAILGRRPAGWLRVASSRAERPHPGTEHRRQGA